MSKTVIEELLEEMERNVRLLEELEDFRTFTRQIIVYLEDE